MTVLKTQEKVWKFKIFLLTITIPIQTKLKYMGSYSYFKKKLKMKNDYQQLIIILFFTWPTKKKI